MCDVRLPVSRRALGVCCLVMFSAFLCGGCETPPAAAPPGPIQAADSNEPGATQRPVVPAASSGFVPSRIEVLPLTELIPSSGPEPGTQLNVYVSLLDAFGTQIKAPVTLRFELCEYVQRSAEPKGQRIAIWPDINLTDPGENHRYWQDFLRAYAFELATEAARNRTYIIEVTCMCPSGKRLSADFALRPDN